jgi:transcription initiation factor IIE alpha subunit
LLLSLQKMETLESSQEGVAPRPKMVHYYYINYQQFVNVVKYKFDQMRKKLESEDKMVRPGSLCCCCICLLV